MMQGAKRSLLLTILMVAIAAVVRGQVMIIPEVQASGIIMKQQVMSLMINNLSGDIKKASLYITITDRNTSQVLLEVNSGLLMINPGVKRITFQELSPLNFAVAIIGFSDVRQLNQPLPVGEYVICYHLYETGTTVKAALASECVKVFAEPLSPPQLILPENGSMIREIRPTLSWTPPAPVYMFNSLTYDIVVSPLYENQSPEEALQRNIPAMTTASINNSISYPASYTNLEKGKTYAWQVIAKDAGRFGGKSEVWTFSVMPDSVEKILSGAPYVQLRRHNGEATVLHQGVLKMEYFNGLADSMVTVELYRVEERNKKFRQAMSFQLRVGKGQNFLDYALDRRRRLDESATYEVRLVNSKKEEWLMRFTPRYYF
jgi:hypothetical protein